MTKQHKPDVFTKVALCPSCGKKRRLTVMGYVDEKTEFGVQAICPSGHFLKGIK